MKVIYSLLALAIVSTALAQVKKQRVSNCEIGTCGAQGTCGRKRYGDRCECAAGRMGPGCKRPCQDVYKSCDAWQDRCHWAKMYTGFFDDNCASTCQTCTETDMKLEHPIAPMLEPLSWLVGTWTASHSSGERFPVSLEGPYDEVLDVKLTPVPMFDRPALNFSIKATLNSDPNDETVEIGFITSKPFNEDTGFYDLTQPEIGDDLIALELNSNSGINTIEEGIMRDNLIRLNATWSHAYVGMESSLYTSAQRTFELIQDGVMEEKATVSMSDGRQIEFSKRFTRVYDYLDTNNLVR